MLDKFSAVVDKVKNLSSSFLSLCLSLGMILLVLKLFFNINLFGVIDALKMSTSELMGLFIIFLLLAKKA